MSNSLDSDDFFRRKKRFLFEILILVVDHDRASISKVVNSSTTTTATKNSNNKRRNKNETRPEWISLGRSFFFRAPGNRNEKRNKNVFSLWRPSTTWTWKLRVRRVTFWSLTDGRVFIRDSMIDPIRRPIGSARLPSRRRTTSSSTTSERGQNAIRHRKEKKTKRKLGKEQKKSIKRTNRRRRPNASHNDNETSTSI